MARQQLCTRITLFCTFLYRRCTTYEVKVPNFSFCRGRKHKTTTFFFFSWTLIQSLRIQFQKHLPNDEISAINKIKQDWNSSFFQPAVGASALQCHICAANPWRYFRQCFIRSRLNRFLVLYNVAWKPYACWELFKFLYGQRTQTIWDFTGLPLTPDVAVVLEKSQMPFLFLRWETGSHAKLIKRISILLVPS